MQTIGITGGTGFIGGHLADLLNSKGCHVVIFTTHPEKQHHGSAHTYTYWDPVKNKCDLTALKQLDAMIHLSGAGIADKRWTVKRKKEIVTSRTEGTHFLITQLKAHAPKCKTFIAASAIGYYGPDNGSEPFTENAPAYNDFLGHTCVLWEKESLAAKDICRTVIFRFGNVLGREHGVFPELEKPVKFGIMPILGSGKHIMSWIHIEDLSNLLVFSLNNKEIEGVYNAVSEKPVTQKELMKTIAKLKGGIRIPVPVPSMALKILFGEVSKEVLKSCTVSNKKILEKGFNFKYPTIDGAVKAILD